MISKSCQALAALCVFLCSACAKQATQIQQNYGTFPDVEWNSGIISAKATWENTLAIARDVGSRCEELNKNGGTCQGRECPLSATASNSGARFNVYVGSNYFVQSQFSAAPEANNSIQLSRSAGRIALGLGFNLRAASDTAHHCAAPELSSQFYAELTRAWIISGINLNSEDPGHKLRYTHAQRVRACKEHFAQTAPNDPRASLCFVTPGIQYDSVYTDNFTQPCVQTAVSTVYNWARENLLQFCLQNRSNSQHTCPQAEPCFYDSLETMRTVSQGLNFSIEGSRTFAAQSWPEGETTSISAILNKGSNIQGRVTISRSPQDTNVTAGVLFKLPARRNTSTERDANQTQRCVKPEDHPFLIEFNALISENTTKISEIRELVNACATQQ